MADQENVGPAYMFNRNFRSYNRRNYNHWMMKEMCGHLLHPNIAKPTDNACVADVQAGTGIWLFETAATVSKAVRLDGFDASAINYPPQPWWPENVRLNTHDVLRPFPEEYHSRYDIVHAGFALRLVDDRESEILLKNLTSILSQYHRPSTQPDRKREEERGAGRGLIIDPEAGGYLQLFVPNAIEAKIHTGGSTPSKASVQQLTPLFRVPRSDASYSWLTNTRGHFESHGLAIVTQTDYSMRDHLKLMWAQNNLITAFTDFPPTLPVSRTGLGQAMAQVLGGPREEVRDTPSVDIPWVCFVARKTL